MIDYFSLTPLVRVLRPNPQIKPVKFRFISTIYLKNLSDDVVKLLLIADPYATLDCLLH